MNKTEVKYMETEANKSIVRKLTLLTGNKYKPSPFMEQSFMQSLYNIRHSRTLRVNYTRELITLKDGGQFSLDWAYPFDSLTNTEFDPPSNTKILFVIHGLTGGSNMNYIKAMI